MVLQGGRVSRGPTPRAGGKRDARLADDAREDVLSTSRSRLGLAANERRRASAEIRARREEEEEEQRRSAPRVHVPARPGWVPLIVVARLDAVELWVGVPERGREREARRDLGGREVRVLVDGARRECRAGWRSHVVQLCKKQKQACCREREGGEREGSARSGRACATA